MNTINQTPSELLNLMIDGELAPEMQEQLHSYLNEDKALQDEMNELLKIRESVLKDTEAFTPPQESRDVIYSMIGFTTASTIAGAASNPGFWGNFVGVASKFWMPIAGAITGSIVTALIVTNIYNNKIDDIQKSSSNTKANNIAVVSSKEVDNSSSSINTEPIFQSSAKSNSVAPTRSHLRINRFSDNSIASGNGNNNSAGTLINENESGQSNIAASTISTPEISGKEQNNSQEMNIPIIYRLLPEQHNYINYFGGNIDQDDVNAAHQMIMQTYPNHENMPSNRYYVSKTYLVDFQGINSNNTDLPGMKNNMALSGYLNNEVSIVGINFDFSYGFQFAQKSFLVSQSSNLNGFPITVDTNKIVSLGQVSFNLYGKEWTMFNLITPGLNTRFGFATSGGFIYSVNPNLEINSNSSLFGSQLNFIIGYDYSSLKSNVNQGFNFGARLKF